MNLNPLERIFLYKSKVMLYSLFLHCLYSLPNRNHLWSTNNKFWEDVEKREPLYTFGGNVNWCSHCGKQYGSFSKKTLKIELPYELGIYPKKPKTLIHKDTCTPMFIAALFIIAKVWKHPKYPSTDE